MTIKDEVDNLKQKTKSMESAFKSADTKKKFNLPFKFRKKKPFKQGKVLVVWLGYNHNVVFKWGVVRGGLIIVDGEQYRAYESGAVYFYKNKFPVVLLFEWRLTPAGGTTEQRLVKPIGGDEDKRFADDNGLFSHAQQTIIRAIMQAEIDKDEQKKKGGKSIIWIVIGIGIALYFILKALGYM